MPKITITESARYYDRGVARPSPHLNVSIFDLEGNKVGEAGYSVSPHKDCLYLSTIKIDDAYLRKGYGLVFLMLLAKTHKLPIVPVEQVDSANAFWDAARHMADGLVVKRSLSMWELETEKQLPHWKHLQPEIDLLNNVIQERLHIHREPYEKAVGRGPNE